MLKQEQPNLPSSHPRSIRRLLSRDEAACESIAAAVVGESKKMQVERTVMIDRAEWERRKSLNWYASDTPEILESTARAEQ